MHTKLTRAEKILDLSQKIMTFCKSDKSAEENTVDIIIAIQQIIVIEAVGLRLSNGFDYPYFFTKGFSPLFVQKEFYLCTRDYFGTAIKDSSGKPILECMCGNVLCGRIDSSLPCFTQFGSFWTNSTTGLLASTTEEQRQSKTRNQCNKEGYESVALIPIKSGEKILGLLQFNDKRENVFTEEDIRFFEGVASTIAVVLSSAK
jgi:hypothetical protein